MKEPNGKPATVKELETGGEEKVDAWHIQQLLNSISKQQQVQNVALNQLNSGGRRSVNSNSSSSSLVNSSSTNNNLELDLKPPKNSSSPTNFTFSNRNSPSQPTAFSLNGNATNGSGMLLGGQSASLLNSSLQSSLTNVNSANNLSNLTAGSHPLNTSASNSSNSFPNRTRIRTSFDPEHELPKLHRWFGENQHPSRQQIQDYVRILNNLESRRGRKPLDVNNVVYWFKNARAAAKRNPGARIGVNGQSPQQMNGSSLSNLGEQLNPNELMLAQFNQQRQLMTQLQLLNQQQQSQSSIADLLNSGPGKNALKSLMLKNGLMDDELLNCEQDDEDQAMNDFGESRDSNDEDNPNEDTDQTFSNFAQTLDLSVKQQQQQQQSTGGSNLKRRKIDTSSTFDECDEADDKDSIDGSASPVNQKFRNSLNCNKSRFAVNNKLNMLAKQPVNAQANQRHLLLDADSKEDNSQSLVNSDGEQDEENQESDAELDDKDYYQSFMRETMQNASRNINQLTQGLIANSNNNNLANLISNSNYLQTVNDFFMNRLLSPQTAGNAASALANSNLLSSAAGLIAASSAGGLNPNVVNAHPLAALNNPAASSSFPAGNLLLNNPHSPDDGIRRIRRSRTFIDPITEVPRLQTWFSQNTHPSHSQIVCYTDDLNKLPYRQKFPKLEPKNVQFWFKNHRAKVSVLNRRTRVHPDHWTWLA